VVFLAFLASKIDLRRLLEPSSEPKADFFKKYPVFSPKNGQQTTKTSKNQALWHQISHYYNGLAVCAKRLNKNKN